MSYKDGHFKLFKEDSDRKFISSLREIEFFIALALIVPLTRTSPFHGSSASSQSALVRLVSESSRIIRVLFLLRRDFLLIV